MNDKYLSYANKVINGDIVASQYIQLAAKRYLEWFKREDIEFRENKVDKVINFISKLKHYQGRHKGKPFILQEWLIFIVANIFGWYYKGTDKRVTKNVYIEVGRKAGKSALIAAISLYCLLADGEGGSEVDCIANNRKLAKILFDIASNFTDSLDGKHKYIKPYRDTIKFAATKSFMQVLSSDASGLDGFNAYCFVQDELHEAKNSKLYDVLKSSLGMRENPLAICITSAGFNLFGFCYEMRKICIEVLKGIKLDDSQFSAIYALDENDDWTDENNWIKANPNLDITVTKDYLRELVVLAKNNPSLEVGVRTKNFGQWVNSMDVWVSNDIILDCTDEVNIEDYKESFCYIGVDLSSVSDLTAVSVMIPIDDKCIYKNWYYLPESALLGNANSELYKLWKQKGYLTITNGNVVDYDYILKDILSISETLLINKIAYDSYNSTQWAINATAEGLPLEPFSQALWHFNRATKDFERLAKLKRVVIDNNEITRWCFSNVSLKRDWNDNVKPIKAHDMQKIDGTIAMLEALGAYLETDKYNNTLITI